MNLKEQNNMDFVKLTETIVKSIVTKEELVAVKEFETEESNTRLIQVLVDKEDMPIIIGKNGKVINAIRTLVQASSYHEKNETIKINVDSI